MELLTLISVLIAAASVLICVFVIRRVKTRLNGMLDALADIKAGNGSRRILSTMDELTAPIAYEINDIVSSYEKKAGRIPPDARNQPAAYDQPFP